MKHWKPPSCAGEDVYKRQQQYGFSSPEELDEACSAAYTAMQESLAELKQDVYKRQA